MEAMLDDSWLCDGIHADCASEELKNGADLWDFFVSEITALHQTRN